MSGNCSGCGVVFALTPRAVPDQRTVRLGLSPSPRRPTLPRRARDTLANSRATSQPETGWLAAKPPRQAPTTMRCCPPRQETFGPILWSAVFPQQVDPVLRTRLRRSQPRRSRCWCCRATSLWPQWPTRMQGARPQMVRCVECDSESRGVQEAPQRGGGCQQCS